MAIRLDSDPYSLHWLRLSPLAESDATQTRGRTVAVGMRFEWFMSRALQRWRVSIATRRYLLGDAVRRVIRLHAGMVLDALEMRDELGRDAIGQIGWNVVELAGP